MEDPKDEKSNPKPKKKEYDLLKFHMDCNPDYMFGHAILSGMLASNAAEVSSYEKYVSQCRKQGIEMYNEKTYNEFMNECGRPIPKPTVPCGGTLEYSHRDIEKQHSEGADYIYICNRCKTEYRNPPYGNPRMCTKRFEQ